MLFVLIVLAVACVSWFIGVFAFSQIIGSFRVRKIRSFRITAFTITLWIGILIGAALLICSILSKKYETTWLTAILVGYFLSFSRVRKEIGKEVNEYVEKQAKTETAKKPQEIDELVQKEANYIIDYTESYSDSKAEAIGLLLLLPIYIDRIGWHLARGKNCGDVESQIREPLYNRVSNISSDQLKIKYEIDNDTIEVMKRRYLDKFVDWEFATGYTLI